MARYDVTSGATSTGIILNYDFMYVSMGGTATETTVNFGGSMFVSSGGTADSTTVNDWGGLNVYSGGVANSTTVNSGGDLIVYSGGTANSTTVNSGGLLVVSSGGTAAEIKAADGAYLHFNVAPDTYIQGTSAGSAFEIKDGAVTDYAVNSGDDLIVFSGGTAANATVNSGGDLYVSSGGTANGITVNSGGRLYVSSGGSATNIVWTPCEGRVTVSDGGYATFAGEYSGVYFGSGNKLLSSAAVMDGKTLDDGYEMCVMKGGTATNATVNFGGSMFVSSGATANNATVNSYGYLDVYSGGTANSTTVNSGYLSVYSGGVATNTTVNSIGYFDVYSGGTAASTTVNSGGNMRVSGTATEIKAADGACLYFDVAPDTYIQGTSAGSAFEIKDGAVTDYTVNSGGLNVYSGGVANSTTVNSFGYLDVYSGGTANSTTVNSGYLYVYSGGTANSTTVNQLSYLYVYSGVANNTTVNSGGRLYVSSGGTATEIKAADGAYLYFDVAPDTYIQGTSAGSAFEIKDGAVTDYTVNSYGHLWVSSGGTVTNATVNSGGSMRVYSGGTANNTTVNKGELYVSSGGTATNATVNSSGYLYVYSGATANNAMVNSGGSMTVSSGGKLTGKMTFETGALVTAENGAILDFDLTKTTPGAHALVTPLSVINGAPEYTLTVAGSETEGTYKLAADAYGFDKTITVLNTSGTELGTLTVDGGTQELDGEKYTLTMDEFGTLMVIVGDPTPPNGPEEPLNDYLYDKKKTPAVNANVTEAYGTHLTEAGQEVYLDQNGSIDHDGYHNRVGTDDEFDYAKIVLEHGAKLSFHAEATAAATFTVYSLNYNETKDKYSLKKLQTLKLKDKDRDGVFTADSSKQLQLQVSGAYYVSMQFKDKKAEEAYYNVTLNDSGKNPSVFYPLGNNTDDWGDMKTAGYGGAVGDLGVINVASIEADKTVIADEWIGFGDKADYKKFTLKSAAELSLNVSAPDGPLKLTVCKLKETTPKKGVTTYSQTKVKSVTVPAKQGTASLSSLQLEAGDYFFRVDSGDVKKSTGYSVQVTDSTFYTDADGGWNNWLYDKKENAVNDLMGAHVDTYAETKIDFDCDVYHDDYYNFVGFGDTCDYSEIYVDEVGLYNFRFDTTGKAKFTVYSLTRNSKGKWTQKVLGSRTISDVNGATGATLKKDVKLSATDGNLRYFVSMQAVDTKKSPEVYYNVMSFPTAVSVADALSMPTDSPIFGQFEADALADVSAASFAELDGKSAWQTVANLA